MVAGSSLFRQLLQHFPRTEFGSLVLKHQAERHSKGFTCWSQFVSMLFCQVAQADSLREICNGLKCCLGKLNHLGLSRGPNKSTLSYANQHRPAALFEDLFWTTLKRFRQQHLWGSRTHQFRFRNKLLSMDSTTIGLCLNLFPWARLRTGKGGVKVHVLLDHDDYMPRFVHLTEARASDVRMAHQMPLNPGSFVAADRAYVDYSLFEKWCLSRVFFVCRSYSDARYVVLEQRRVPQHRHILSDDVIRLTGRGTHGPCRHPLRRIVVERDDHPGHPLVLLTNHLDFGASTIAAIYRDRWQIEVFFKTLKQNLKIKSFIGTSENALRIQIWTALIALLLLKWLHFLSRARWSLSNLVTMLRLNLFTYRDLLDWLDDPFGTPPLQPLAEQLVLNLGQPNPSHGGASF
jgi:hypothetical protein